MVRKESRKETELAMVEAADTTCIGDCEIKKYTYGDPTDITVDAGGGMANRMKFKDLNKDQQKAITDAVDKLPKQAAGGCKDDTCVCVENADQPKDYPKKSKPVVHDKKVKDPSGPGNINFKIKRTFEVYKGTCDDGDW